MEISFNWKVSDNSFNAVFLKFTMISLVLFDQLYYEEKQISWVLIEIHIILFQKNADVKNIKHLTGLSFDNVYFIYYTY